MGWGTDEIMCTFEFGIGRLVGTCVLQYSLIRKMEFCFRRSLPFLYVPVIGDLTVVNVLVFIVGLIILWIIVSIPVYIAGKVVTAGESTLGDAMIATLFGPIVYAVTLILVDFFLGTLIGTAGFILALVIAFIAWLAVFKASFSTGWLGALAIAIIAILVFAAISFLFGILLGVIIPAPFFPSL
jgi:hypothetical protein